MGLLEKAKKAATESTVGSVVMGPVGAAVGAADSLFNDGKIAKQVGGALSNINPLKKTAVPGQPDIVMPAEIVAPVMDPKAKAVQIAAPKAPKPVTIATVAGPQAASIDMQNNPYAAAQAALVQQLSSQAAGTGPSIAENQLRSAQEANLAATMATINSARGGANPALARAGLQSAAEANGRMAQEAATARLQEQMQAAGLLNTTATGARGQDIDVATQNAQLAQQAEVEQYRGQVQSAISQGGIAKDQALAALDAQVRTNIANGNLAQSFQDLMFKYQALGVDAARANQLAALEIQQLTQGGAQWAGSAQMSADNRQKDNILGVIKGGASALPGLGSMLAASPSAAAPAVATDTGNGTYTTSAGPAKYS